MERGFATGGWAGGEGAGGAEAVGQLAGAEEWAGREGGAAVGTGLVEGDWSGFAIWEIT